MMTEILNAFYLTIELWAFLAVLTIALCVEGLKDHYRNRVIDNPTLR